MQNRANDKFLSLLILIIFVAFSGNLVAQKKNKLIVGIVVDQMCYDYLYRYQHHFLKEGFNTFLRDGINCRNVNYNYVPTYTGPGHASIYTGTSPNNHGIIGNSWYDREAKGNINCVEDLNETGIGTLSSNGKASPKRLKTYTITDQLKLSYPSAKVISLSIKNRSAILPGGHLSNGSYWFDSKSGTFTTSSYYMKKLPDWLLKFNATKNATSYLADWELLYPIENYVAGKKDSSKYEAQIGGKTTAVFPYNFTEFSSEDFSDFTISPAANSLLTDLAIDALKNESLGKDDQTDMLCLSYSTPDIAGHSFGPYSLEMEDMYARLDLELAKLIKAISEQVGRHNFTLFLTADHAVVPIPQMLMDMRLPGGYHASNSKLKSLKAAVKTEFNSNISLKETNENIYLNRKEIDSLKLNFSEVCQFIANEIREWPEVKSVFTAHQLLEDPVGNDEWRKMLFLGFDYQRSGDILYLLQPGYLPVADESEKKGTSHGSAFNYDTHVPLLWYGGGLKAKDVFRPMDITDISATLTHLLFLQRSGAMTGQPIVEVLEKK